MLKLVHCNNESTKVQYPQLIDSTTFAVLVKPCHQPQKIATKVHAHNVHCTY